MLAESSCVLFVNNVEDFSRKEANTGRNVTNNRKIHLTVSYLLLQSQISTCTGKVKRKERVHKGL